MSCHGYFRISLPNGPRDLLHAALGKAVDHLKSNEFTYFSAKKPSIVARKLIKLVEPYALKPQNVMNPSDLQNGARIAPLGDSQKDTVPRQIEATLHRILAGEPNQV